MTPRPKELAMRHSLKCLPAGLIAALSCAAEAAPTSQPVAAPAFPANPVILVLPIAAPPQGGRDWIGRSIQQDLVADLTQVSRARVIAPASAPPAADEQSALAAARDAGAGFVIYGQSQASGNQMRVTGQLLEVPTGKPLAALKATAPVEDLFPLEDSLAAQAAHALPAPLLLRPPSNATANTAGQPPYRSETVPPSDYIPTQVIPAPYYSYTEPLPDTYYSYNTYYAPYSGWWNDPWPWWGGVAIFGGFGFGEGHFHDHDHDHDHDWGYEHHPYSSGHFVAPHVGGHAGIGHGSVGHYGIGSSRGGFVGGVHGGAIGGAHGGGGSGGGGHAGGGGGHSR
jgi:TolB-like protein